MPPKRTTAMSRALRGQRLPPELSEIVTDFDDRGSLELIRRQFDVMRAFIAAHEIPESIHLGYDLMVQYKDDMQQNFNPNGLRQRIEHLWGGARNVPEPIRVRLEEYERVYNEYVGTLRKALDAPEGAGVRTSYQQFVKENFHSAKGSTPQEKMKSLGQMWKGCAMP